MARRLESPCLLSRRIVSPYYAGTARSTDCLANCSLLAQGGRGSRLMQNPNKGYVKLASRLRDCLWLRWGSRGPRCEAPKWRDHKINQRRSSSNMNIPQMVKDEEEEE